MGETIDGFLNRITMYRLVLYGLFAILAVAAVEGAVGLVPHGPVPIVVSTAMSVTVCWLVNAAFAWAFRAPSNEESVWITALILACIVSPPAGAAIGDWAFVFWAATLAMASKYLFAWNRKHLFNPAAFAVAVCGLAGIGYASWWVATLPLLPVVLAVGLLIARKIRRFDLACAFFLVAVLAIVLTSPSGNALELLRRTVVDTPLVFFGFVMLTEPFTTPPTRGLRVAYGALAGALFAPRVLHLSPEIALLAANAFSFVVSPKGRYVLTLLEKAPLGGDMTEFVFAPDRDLAFRPGQFLEWTLLHGRPDDRGIRRYFTIASSPTEDEVRLGVKFYPKPSTFKTRLQALRPGDTITVTQLAGDFTMPKDRSRKLAFLAGGIGVTPFRSMARYLIDADERRDALLFYSNRTADEIAYRDVFAAAEPLGWKTVYTVTGPPEVSAAWAGERGTIDAAMIKKHIPDWKERAFYVSGPHAMVTAMEKTLRELGVRRKDVKTDYFPGFA